MFQNRVLDGAHFISDIKLLLTKKAQNTVQWTYVVSDLNGEEIVETFYEKQMQNTVQTKFRVEKVIKKKDNRLCVKWKGSGHLFNSWINMKDIV